MRNVMSLGTNTLIWATVLASCYQFGFSSPVNDDALSKSLDDSSETDPILIKKDWSKSLHGWGKRSWSSLHGEWGKRDSSDYPVFDKKAWQSLQGGWGKRSSADDDYILNNIVDGISDDGPIPEYSYFVDNENDDEKRAWNNLHSTGWGKRSGRKWGNFKGLWGKREPAWTNLKGIWGKRSGPLQ